ncbi:MAG: hypothetical protein JOY79_02005, partial [Acidobacteriaceae bacterium]|nr:hypothetical protein [Acidobacteriaceae bacterium]
MSRARQILLISGFALALWGMCWGLCYAVFVEHQTLDSMGSHITAAFVHGAERNLPQSRAALAGYSSTQFDYVRQVDVHSHWIGLAMVLILLGVVFDRVSFGEDFQVSLALMLAIGS